MRKIAIGCDHIVTPLKNTIRDWLINKGYDVIDCGTYDSVRTHYPIYGKRVADLVSSGFVEKGIVICGTAVGITNAAQKVPGARVALARDVATTKRARELYDANIIGFGGRIVGEGLAQDIVETFLNTDFVDSEKNISNVKYIDNILSKEVYKPNEHNFSKYRKMWEQGKYTD